MGKITIDEMHNSLFDYAQAVSDESLMTESKTIVGAINEIYGKNLIADSIGEPLNNTDTYTKMSNDINSLLSTFKTNMMNAGVVVESSDKFKQLIDKIKGLTEGEGNKGIQFAEGTCAVTNSLITHNCGFIPTYFFVLAGRISMQYKTSNGFYNSVLYNPVISNIRMFGSDTSIGISGSSSITELNESTAKISNISGDVTWYAIGVGEEDTTLRDSLADILENKGVDVTEEDDMASLITKVDSISSGLDIISATELPATGKENQICVITDNPVENFRISNLQTDILNDGNIYLKLGFGSGPSSGNITIGTTVQNIYHVDGVYQNNIKLKSYVYQNGNWIEFTKTGIDIMVNGSYTVDSETYGTLKERSGDITFTDGNGLWMNYGLVSSGRSGFMHTYLTKKIDVSGFTKVKVTLKDMDYGGTASTNMLTYLHFFDSAPTKSLLTDPDPDGNYPSKGQNIGKSDFASKEIVFDISDMSGSYYLDFEIYTPSDSSGYYVDVRLTDFSIE